MEKVYIVAAKRTCIGNFGGGLSSLSPVELGRQCVEDLLADHQGLKDSCDMLICGNVLGAGHGQNMARQIAIHSGIDESIPSFTLNHVCGSGLQAVMLAAQQIKCGDVDVVIAGGVESMSQAPYILKKQRFGSKLGHQQVLDSIIQDGLWDAFCDIHMGETAENVAKKWSISREEQDEFAFHSQQKAASARRNEVFRNEISPVEVRIKKDILLKEQDEFIREDTSLDTLSKLRPAFTKDGSVTAGNASGINDGAAFLVIISEKKMKELNLTPLVCINEYCSTGYDPALMGVAPLKGIETLLKKSHSSIGDVDLFEINEAFAAQSIVIQKELKIPKEKINVNGGAIALGHPIGASGARILVTLCHEMQRRSCHKGVASLCIGGGQSVSISVSV
ncbi:acetyl-CoA C-acyltransferase [Candidatus Marinamargulisbacteria bacterium SCGC AG-343-D04]|nr:acetyl-CoA C-acyltransferase [Candidatus Marinamargulisbacteria bacterium SCGC AG-343-D04]